jgi:gamma-glutamyltranspeptidase/glutathione hydrolase
VIDNRPVNRRAAVAATSPLAAQAGLDLIHAGGTAVDAAIAAMLVATVTEPGVVSPLGGAFVNIWPADGSPVVVDGNVEMPGRGLPRERFGAGVREIHTTYGGGLTVFAGHGSVATPGAFAAFGRAHERHGAAPWAELLAPAISAARDGFPLGAAAASYLALVHDSIFGWDEQTRAFHSSEGVPHPAGTTLRSPELAGSLSHLAHRGWTDLYTGDLAEQVAADMAARGGLVTAADLATYDPQERPALLSTLDDWSIAANPPPSIGGPVLTAMLLMLARREDPGPDDLIRIQREVLGYRRKHLDVSQDLLEAGRDLIRTVTEQNLAALPTSSSTAHVSVVDSDGTACAITASAGYGSGVTVPGTGLVLNNCLGEPELNRRGLHALAPGTRLASNMAPTTARHRDGARLAVGSPGADRITTALLQVLAAFCLEGADLQSAIDRPRLHVSTLEDGSARIEHEDDDALREAVQRSGLPARVHGHRDMFFGGVGATLRDADGGLSAAGDGRRAAATVIG